MDRVIGTVGGMGKLREPMDWSSFHKAGNYVFLAQGPERVLFAILAYLLFVFKIGPMLMAKQQPYELKNPVRLYNLLNISANVYLAVRGLMLANWGLNFFTCNCLKMNPISMATYMDHFAISRVIDFLDTIFFVLRKKDNQISGLHVFHHAIVPISVYGLAYFSMTPFTTFFLVINAMVHIIMYCYYLLATFPSIAKHLWWKRYITRIQISQFVVALTYNFVGYFMIRSVCKPSWNPIMPVIINGINASIFLVLFYMFYRSTYKAANAAKQENAKQIKKQN